MTFRINSSLAMITKVTGAEKKLKRAVQEWPYVASPYAASLGNLNPTLCHTVHPSFSSRGLRDS